MRFSMIAILAFVSTPAYAQSTISTTPAAVQEYYGGMINSADLVLKYCDGESYSWFGLVKHERTCVSIPSPCMGQCCEQGIADYYGYDEHPQWTGAWRIPDGYLYAGWECKPFGQTTKGLALSGNPGPRK